MGTVNVIQTPNSYRIPLPKSVVDPDLLNSDPDTDLDPAFQVNPDPCEGFFLVFNVVTFGYFMEGNSVIPPMDMKQYRYLNFDKIHPLILTYHEKV
jgi:hypothetical protein